MKESVRIFRFIVIGTMNALIMALVVWLMMREMSFEGDYMVANVTAYVIAQILIDIQPFYQQNKE